MSSSRGGRGADKGKRVVVEDDSAAQQFPQDYWDFDEEEEDQIPTAADMPNVEMDPTQGGIHFHPPTQDTREAVNLKSEIWVHFHKIDKSAERGPKQFDVICNYCGKNYKYIAGQGYGTFKRHLNTKHPTEAGIDKSQQQISRYATAESQLFRYNDNVYKEEFGKMVCVEHLSYSFGEKLQFNTFMQTAACPQAKRIPRNTVKRTINKLYKYEKANLINTFMNLKGGVHIGSDIWSDHWQMHSYMGVTCHWIDDDFNIQKRVLAFRLMDDRHTATNIYRVLRQILEEYFLLQKVFSIGFDNASANTASIAELQAICMPSFGGKFFHIRCACHVLNLCVQDGLKTLDAYISPIKNAISYLWRHSQIMKEWGKFCKNNGRPPRRFPRDIPTRWNSTYELLSSSLQYSDLLCTFITNNVPSLTLFPQHWVVCSTIMGILKVFNDATYTLSGVYYPTSHLFIVECINIADVFFKYENDDLLKPTIESMRIKWLHYYKHIPTIYLVACFFDPRCKIGGLIEMLKAYYQCLHLEDDDDVNVMNIEVNVRKIIFDLCIDFGGRLGVTPTGWTSSSDLQTLSRGQQILAQRNKKQKGPAVGSNNNEMDDYISTRFEFEAFDDQFPILDWWRKHATEYPVLASIAKQILATPCSTVAVEQTFSAGGNILDERRSRLQPENLEAQACVDDWTKAQNRQQEMDRNNNEFFEDDGGDTTTTGTGGSD